jgi:hypothetical protein
MHRERPVILVGGMALLVVDAVLIAHAMLSVVMVSLKLAKSVMPAHPMELTIAVVLKIASSVATAEMVSSMMQLLEKHVTMGPITGNRLRTAMLGAIRSPPIHTRAKHATRTRSIIYAPSRLHVSILLPATTIVLAELDIALMVLILRTQDSSV